MKARLHYFRDIDRRSLFIGLGIVASFYLLFYVYILTFSASVVQEIESTLASQIIPLQEKTATETKDESHETGKTEIPILIEGLYEKDPTGNLPIIREADALTSFNGYKRPFNFEHLDKPVLSIVITDFGLSKSASENALDMLPAEVSVSISPYADMMSEWAKIMRQSGREFWLNIPFERSGAELGAATIHAKAGFSKNQKALHATLGQAQAYPGISSVSDPNSDYDDNQIVKAMEEVFGRGLGYLELNPNANSSVSNVALAKNSPYIKADIEIVFTPDRDPFEGLEDILKTQGHAVAVVANYPQNIQRLAEWIVKVAQADYQLAPVSAMYELPLHQQKTSSAPATKNAPVEEPVAALPPHTAAPPEPTTAGDLLTTDKVAPPPEVETSH